MTLGRYGTVRPSEHPMIDYAEATGRGYRTEAGALRFYSTDDVPFVLPQSYITAEGAIGYDASTGECLLTHKGNLTELSESLRMGIDAPTFARIVSRHSQYAIQTAQTSSLYRKEDVTRAFAIDNDFRSVDPGKDYTKVLRHGLTSPDGMNDDYIATYSNHDGEPFGILPRWLTAQVLQSVPTVGYPELGYNMRIVSGGAMQYRAHRDTTSSCARNEAGEYAAFTYFRYLACPFWHCLYIGTDCDKETFHNEYIPKDATMAANLLVGYVIRDGNTEPCIYLSRIYGDSTGASHAKVTDFLTRICHAHGFHFASYVNLADSETSTVYSKPYAPQYEEVYTSSADVSLPAICTGLSGEYWQEQVRSANVRYCKTAKPELVYITLGRTIYERDHSDDVEENRVTCDNCACDCGENYSDTQYHGILCDYCHSELYMYSEYLGRYVPQ